MCLDGIDKHRLLLTVSRSVRDRALWHRSGHGIGPVKGRSTFSQREATEIRATLPALSRARLDGDRQRAKALRDSLRALPFYISDWERDRQGFELSDFERLVSEGSIQITS